MSLAEQWLHSRKHATLDGVELALVPHTHLRNVPLSISRGQAMAYFLKDRASQSWILKKFLPGKDPEAVYIRAIRALVPAGTGFESGSQRRVLSRTSVGRGFSPAGFADWIANTILMPRVGGADWLNLAESVREGSESLTVEQRIAMCTSLVQRVQALEAHGLSHRDLSVTNVFVDPATWEVHFIDWDTLYHESLQMPQNTTIGTGGYTSPIVLAGGRESVAQTWCKNADRFAMAVLCAEFLLVERGSVMANDGGMFEQAEIYARAGGGLAAILAALNTRFPPVGRLLHRALAAETFEQCPSPAEWLACSTFAAPIQAPRLRDVDDFMARFERHIQSLQQPRVPVRPAPRLSELPPPDLTPLRRVAAAPPPRPAPRLDEMPDPADSEKVR